MATDGLAMNGCDTMMGRAMVPVPPGISRLVSSVLWAEQTLALIEPFADDALLRAGRHQVEALRGRLERAVNHWIEFGSEIPEG